MKKRFIADFDCVGVDSKGRALLQKRNGPLYWASVRAAGAPKLLDSINPPEISYATLSPTGVIVAVTSTGSLQTLVDRTWKDLPLPKLQQGETLISAWSTVEGMLIYVERGQSGPSRLLMLDRKHQIQKEWKTGFYDGHYSGTEFLISDYDHQKFSLISRQGTESWKSTPDNWNFLFAAQGTTIGYDHEASPWTIWFGTPESLKQRSVVIKGYAVCGRVEFAALSGG